MIRQLAVIAALIAVAHPSSAANKHGADIGGAVEFLTALHAGSTLRDVRAQLGSGVKVAGPRWEEFEFAIGSYVRTSGHLQGIVVFLNDAQRKIVKEGRYPDLKPDDPIKQFHPSDRIEVATIDLGKVKGKAETAALIQAVIVRLGKPSKREYAQHNDENPSWLATWKLTGHRTITLMEDSQVHLIVTFGTPHQP
jgi:hypothetical protein